MVLETGAVSSRFHWAFRSLVNRCHRYVRRCRCPVERGRQPRIRERFSTKKETSQPAWSPEFPKHCAAVLLSFYFSSLLLG